MCSPKIFRPNTQRLPVCNYRDPKIAELLNLLKSGAKIIYVVSLHWPDIKVISHL